VQATGARSIGLACALGLLGKRRPVEWRLTCPHLAAWLASFAENEPAFDRTRPPSN
jgi:hypothetical protein